LNAGQYRCQYYRNRLKSIFCLSGRALKTNATSIELENVAGTQAFARIVYHQDFTPSRRCFQNDSPMFFFLKPCLVSPVQATFFLTVSFLTFGVKLADASFEDSFSQAFPQLVDKGTWDAVLIDLEGKSPTLFHHEVVNTNSGPTLQARGPDKERESCTWTILFHPSSTN
jgi:hypothetical protein